MDESNSCEDVEGSRGGGSRLKTEVSAEDTSRDTEAKSRHGVQAIRGSSSASWARSRSRKGSLRSSAALQRSLILSPSAGATGAKVSQQCQGPRNEVARVSEESKHSLSSNSGRFRRPSSSSSAEMSACCGPPVQRSVSCAASNSRKESAQPRYSFDVANREITPSRRSNKYSRAVDDQ